jgi:hypothetical protein
VRYLLPVAALLSGMLLSCTPVREDGGIEVVSIAKASDRQQADADMCASFTLTGTDVATYFSMAEVVDPAEFHDQALILPCSYQGSIRIAKHPYRWQIFAGGAGYLYDAAGTNLRYLCRDKCLGALPALQ